MTPWNWWHMGPGWGWGGMLIGMIVMLLFWGGVIALAFFAIRWLSRRDIGDPRRDASREDETPLEMKNTHPIQTKRSSAPSRRGLARMENLWIG